MLSHLRCDAERCSSYTITQWGQVDPNSSLSKGQTWSSSAIFSVSLLGYWVASCQLLPALKIVHTMRAAIPREALTMLSGDLRRGEGNNKKEKLLVDDNTLMPTFLETNLQL